MTHTTVRKFEQQNVLRRAEINGHSLMASGRVPRTTITACLHVGRGENFTCAGT